MTFNEPLAERLTLLKEIRMNPIAQQVDAWIKSGKSDDSLAGVWNITEDNIITRTHNGTTRSMKPIRFLRKLKRAGIGADASDFAVFEFITCLIYGDSTKYAFTKGFDGMFNVYKSEKLHIVTSEKQAEKHAHFFADCIPNAQLMHVWNTRRTMARAIVYGNAFLFHNGERYPIKYMDRIDHDDDLDKNAIMYFARENGVNLVLDAGKSVVLNDLDDANVSQVLNKYNANVYSDNKDNPSNIGVPIVIPESYHYGVPYDVSFCYLGMEEKTREYWLFHRMPPEGFIRIGEIVCSDTVEFDFRHCPKCGCELYHQYIGSCVACGFHISLKDTPLGRVADSNLKKYKDDIFVPEECFNEDGTLSPRMAGFLDASPLTLDWRF